jgi:pilus assembly protein CpaB
MEHNETRTLWISIGSAIFAVVLLYGWAQDKRAGYARTFGQTKTVVIAREDIREFEIVDESKLEVVERPSDFIQPAAIQNPTEIVGQIALAPIKKGEQILNTKLVFPDKSTGLSMQVSPGKRAVAIAVSNEKAVAKLIKPGDRVDIVAGVDDGAGVNKIRKVRTILQDIPVLAVGNSIVDNLPIQIVKGEEDNFEIRNLRVDNDYSTMTLEVSPSEAQHLIYLQSVPLPIFFTLRNPNDRIKIQLKTEELDGVLNRVKIRKPAETVPAPTPQPVQQPVQRKKRGQFEKL